MNRQPSSMLVGLILVFAIPAFCLTSSVQHFPSSTSLVPMKDFDTTVPKMEQRIFFHSGEESEIHLSNHKNQHVCFRLNKNNGVMSYHGGIVFLMYDFWDDKTYFSRLYNDIGPRNILKRLTYYDSHGRLKGDGEFKDMAKFEFEVRDLKTFEKTMNRIDEHDGNFDPEDATEKNIIENLIDSKGKLIRSMPISTKDFWEFQHFGGRP